MNMNLHIHVGEFEASPADVSSQKSRVPDQVGVRLVNLTDLF